MRVIGGGPFGTGVAASTTSKDDGAGRSRTGLYDRRGRVMPVEERTLTSGVLLTGKRIGDWRCFRVARQFGCPAIRTFASTIHTLEGPNDGLTLAACCMDVPQRYLEHRVTSLIQNAINLRGRDTATWGSTGLSPYLTSCRIWLAYIFCDIITVAQIQGIGQQACTTHQTTGSPKEHLCRLV